METHLFSSQYGLASSKKSKIQTFKILQVLLVFILSIGYTANNLFAAISEPYFFVKGIVIDSLSGEGLSFVTIQIENNGEVVQRLASDNSGKFSFALNTPGKYNVLFHSVGYRLKKTELTTQTGSNFDLGKVVLSPSTEQVGEVTVSALKPLVRNDADKLIYNVESDPEAKTSNVLDMLQKVPLVSVDGNDNVSLRGMTKIKFLVNGKSSAMLDQNPKEVLRSMPSHTIKDIEVITNPSSKYEAEGAAGIINIITSRKTPDGFNGKINAGISTQGEHSENLYLATKAKKFIFSLNAVNNKWVTPDFKSEINRENYYSEINRYSKNNSLGDGIGKWKSIGAETSFELDTLNLFSLSLTGGGYNYNNTSLSTVSGFDSYYSMTSQFENNGIFDGTWNNFSGTFDYQRSFQRKGRLFTISYRYDYMPGDRLLNNDITGLYNYQGYRQKIEGDNLSTEKTLQIDYVDPVSKKSQIETGLKQIWRNSDALTNHFEYDEDNNIWIRDDIGSSDFDYHQNVIGAYFTYQLKLKKGLFKTGLRAENTMNKGYFKSVGDTSFTSKMFNLVPYLLLTRDFEKGKSLKLSYTNRLSRPGIWYLNPFYNNADPLNTSIGNPKLETEISHSFDFSFNKFSDKFNFSLNTNASFSNNLIYDVSVVKPDGVRVTTYGNIGDDHNIGGTAYASVKLNDKLTVNATVGLYYRNISSNNDMDLQNSGWGKSGKFNFFIKPWKNANILTGAGTTPRYYTLQSISAYHFWSYITYQHDFFDKKLRLETRIDMPFNKYRKYDSKAFNPTFYETTDSQYHARFLTFRFSWSFGQMKDNVKKAKRSITNDDLKQGG